MDTYGLIGYPLGHSFSGCYFADKFAREGISGCEYHNYPIESIDRLPELLAATPSLKGLNITIPYKQAVIPYLDRIDSQAAETGAVNCVRVEPDGTLTGYNTDVYGFRLSLLELIGDLRPNALVLGSGGASKAVTYVLRSLGIMYDIVSRSGQLTYEMLTPDAVAAHTLIINATPLGTFPKTEEFPPIPYEGISAGYFMYDLVYNPPLTRFLDLGRQHGAKIMNGEKMLALQAEKSWEIWRG